MKRVVIFIELDLLLCLLFTVNYSNQQLLHRVRLWPSYDSSGNIRGPLQYQNSSDGLWYNITYEGNYHNIISSHADTACRQLGCTRGTAQTLDVINCPERIELTCFGSDCFIDYASSAPNCSIGTANCQKQVPSRPSSVLVTDQSAHSLTITWTPPRFGRCTAAVSGYQVSCRSTRSTAHANLREKVISGLLPYTRYYCSVSANSFVGTGFPMSVTSRTAEAAPTRPPLMARNNNRTAPRSLTLWWSPPDRAYRNGAIIQYTVEVNRTDTGESQISNSAVTSITVENLHPHTVYSYRIAATTSAGQGPFTETRHITTLQDAPTGSPIVNESRQTSRSLHLQWEPPSPEEQNGIITRYTLQVVYQETGEISENQTLPVSWSVVEGLHPHTIYMYRIAAHTVAGQGPFTPDYSITTLEEAPSGPPLNVTGEVRSSTSLEFEWSPPSEEEWNGHLTGYSVVLEWEEGQEHRVDTADTNYTFTELQQGTTYNCSIAAHTSVGTGPYHIITVATPPAGRASDSGLIAGFTVGISLLLVICITVATSAIFIKWRQKKYGRMIISGAPMAEKTNSKKQRNKCSNKNPHAKQNFSPVADPSSTMVIGTLPSLLRCEDSEPKDHEKIPELPERAYLEDEEFLGKLKEDLFPEINNSHLVDDWMLPELPERKYLEHGHTKMEMKIAPKVPFEQPLSSSTSSSSPSSLSSSHPSVCQPKQEEFIKLHGGEKQSENQYMALCEVTKAKMGSTSKGSAEYMSLGKNVRQEQNSIQLSKEQDVNYSGVEMQGNGRETMGKRSRDQEDSEQDQMPEEGHYMALKIRPARQSEEGLSDGHYMVLSKDTRKRYQMPMGGPRREDGNY